MDMCEGGLKLRELHAQDSRHEVIKNSSLGIAGWALHAVGEDSSPSDDDNNDDLFPEDSRKKLIITDPSAPLVVGGPAPVVIRGHRPGEDRHGENIFDGGTAPVVPLAVGLAPLVSGHRAMDECPLHGAQANVWDLGR